MESYRELKDLSIDREALESCDQLIERLTAKERNTI